VDADSRFVHALFTPPHLALVPWLDLPLSLLGCIHDSIRQRDSQWPIERVNHIADIPLTGSSSCATTRRLASTLLIARFRTSQPTRFERTRPFPLLVG
jgi:hypothetical protein